MTDIDDIDDKNGVVHDTPIPKTYGIIDPITSIDDGAKEWFKRYGQGQAALIQEENGCWSINVEEMYEAFKARMASEFCSCRTQEEDDRFKIIALCPFHKARSKP